MDTTTTAGDASDYLMNPQFTSKTLRAMCRTASKIFSDPNASANAKKLASTVARQPRAWDLSFCTMVASLELVVPDDTDEAFGIAVESIWDMMAEGIA